VIWRGLSLSQDQEGDDGQDDSEQHDGAGSAAPGGVDRRPRVDAVIRRALQPLDGLQSEIGWKFREGGAEHFGENGGVDQLPRWKTAHQYRGEAAGLPP
jgi:hypothetical protein